MAIEVDTKDCTALSDAELAEMADLCADSPNAFEVGMLSKQAEAWVLCTVASEGGKVRGFSFCTLERIGGTPSILIGAGHVCRNTKRDTVLRAIMTDQLRRSVLAFPDEDVLVGSRSTKLLAKSGRGVVASLSASVSALPSTKTVPSLFVVMETRRWCLTMQAQSQRRLMLRSRPSSMISTLPMATP